MVITYYGVSCFKVQSGETILAFDPPSKAFPVKDFGLKLPRFQADLLLISHKQHKGHNCRDSLAGDPFVIDGFGEYEIKGIYINGISSFHDASLGKEKGLNTIYTVSIEGINICHMGDFGEAKLRDETKEAIGDVDILFIPIIGSHITPEKAARIVTNISPKIIIPMHYHKDKTALKKFLSEIGEKNGNPVAKLTIKKKELEGKETQVVVLQTQ